MPFRARREQLHSMAVALTQSLRAGIRWRIQILEDRLQPLLPDRLVYERRFREYFGRSINWGAPRSFNEKIYWLMRYYRRPILTLLADKYSVRRYVSDRIGDHFLNHLYGVWNHPTEIRFETLPSTLVLKMTHGHAMNLFCDRFAGFDVSACRRQLRKWLMHNHYLSYREWAYKHIRPRIIAERLLLDSTWGTPPDYKFFCFSGEPLFVQVDVDRFTNHRRNFFDLQWRPLPFALKYPRSTRTIPRPQNLEEMTDCARILSAQFPFVRVDLYSHEGRTLFGEMTWYPEAGTGHFSPESFDLYWGEYLQLPSSPSIGRHAASRLLAPGAGPESSTLSR